MSVSRNRRSSYYDNNVMCEPLMSTEKVYSVENVRKVMPLVDDDGVFAPLYQQWRALAISDVYFC